MHGELWRELHPEAEWLVVDPISRERPRRVPAALGVGVDLGIERTLPARDPRLREDAALGRGHPKRSSCPVPCSTGVLDAAYANGGYDHDPHCKEWKEDPTHGFESTSAYGLRRDPRYTRQAVAYSRDDIDKVRELTDLAELASEVTKIKRSGRSVMAVCPFHQEKTPSLSIDPERGLYHCFGCGKGGDVFQWIEETQGVDFAGAVELLARRSGVILTQDPQARKRRSDRERLIQANEAAVEFFHERLRTGSDAASARSYLRSRGYEVEAVEEFNIGYSPDSWDTLTRHLSDRFEERVLVASGLASRSRQGRVVDRFRGRVMFPIYDLRGDAVGFGARQLDGDPPKYLNSPETPIYHKSRLLYGLNWSKGEIVRSGEAVVVEGYTDVIALHQAGHPVAVATCGTALGEEHLAILQRFTERVVLAFDSDEAGAGAALRGFEKTIPGDLDLRIALFPPGRDPADLVAHGENSVLLKSVAESIPLLQFRIEQELGRFDLNEAEARGRSVRAVVPLIAAHPDPVVRHEYAVLVSRRTGVDLDVVAQALRRRRPREETTPGSASFDRLSGQELAEREILRLLLANDAGLERDELGPDLFETELHRRAFERIGPVVLGLRAGVTPDLGAALGDDQSDVGALLREVAMVDLPLPEAAEVLNRLKVGAIERRIEKVRAHLEELDPDADTQTYSERFNELIALERQRRDLRSRQ